MDDPLIFSLDHVRSFRKVSVNVEFETYARLVQMKYVEELIGSTLYSALIDDITNGEPTDSRFLDLLDGEVFDDGDSKVIFRGLRLYCSALWTWMYLLDSQAKVTPIGPSIFKDTESEGGQGKQGTENLISSCINLADSLEEKVINYITKDNRFPEYKVNESSDPAEQNNFSFTTIGSSFEFDKSKRH